MTSPLTIFPVNSSVSKAITLHLRDHRNLALVSFSGLSSKLELLQSASANMEAGGTEDQKGASEISLRSLDLSDIDDFMVWATDDKVSRFCTWDTYSSKEAGIEYIKNTVIPHPWFKAICLDGRAIGAISVTPNQGNDRCRGELGYVLASQYWGKGIATGAVKMVASTIFEEWPHLERLEALVDVENGGSQRVLEKAGFQREGVLRKFFIQKGRSRDMIIYSLLSTDPQA